MSSAGPFAAAAAAVLAALYARRTGDCLAVPVPPDIEVTSLHVYPVKSLRGHSLPSCSLDAFGLVNDRRFMLVDSGERPALFMTQRSTPAMAQLTPYLLCAAAHAAVAALPASSPLAAVLAAAAAASPQDFPVPSSASQPPSALLLCLDTAAGAGAGAAAAVAAPWVLVPVLCAAAASPAALLPVSVWSSVVVQCVDQGEGAAAWLRAALGSELALRLVYQDPAHAPSQRVAASSYLALPPALNPAAMEVAAAHNSSSSSLLAGLRQALAQGLLRPLWRLATGGQAASTTFADGFPLLLASQNSLEDMNARIAAAAAARGAAPPAATPMANFRPNIVVRYSAAYPAWLEDTWERFTVAGSAAGAGAGRAAFAGVKRCSRCQVTTTDQLTGARAPSAASGLETDDPFEREPLATLGAYRASVAGPKEGGVFFGMNLMHVQQGGGLGWGSVRVGDRLCVASSRWGIGPL
jgi:uncharacterized protein YcbX